MCQQSGWKCIFLQLDRDWPFPSMGHGQSIYEWFAPSHSWRTHRGSSDNTKVLRVTPTCLLLKVVKAMQPFISYDKVGLGFCCIPVEIRVEDKWRFLPLWSVSFEELVKEIL